jgi:hypothetical protein
MNESNSRQNEVACEYAVLMNGLQDCASKHGQKEMMALCTQTFHTSQLQVATLHLLKGQLQAPMHALVAETSIAGMVVPVAFGSITPRHGTSYDPRR